MELTPTFCASSISAFKRSRAALEAMHFSKAPASTPASMPRRSTSWAWGLLSGALNTRSWYGQKRPWSCAQSPPSESRHAPA